MPFIVAMKSLPIGLLSESSSDDSVCLASDLDLYMGRHGGVASAQFDVA